MLCVIWSLRYLRYLVYGRHITIITDHHALCWLKSVKEATGKFARWAIKLSEYQYTIVHKNGTKHQDAYCLSRYRVLPGTQEDADEATNISTYQIEIDTLRYVYTWKFITFYDCEL